MPNLTTPIPPKPTGNANADVFALKQWGTALIDELSYLFNNLDAGNVIEASSVKAENIETKTAKISNAQIGALSADKIQAGCVDTELVTVGDRDGNLEISDSGITVADSNRTRFEAKYNKNTDKFIFRLFNEDGEPTISISSSGDAKFNGTVESANIFSSTIIGTDSDSYYDEDGGVFANIDKQGIRIMQDDDGRKQKIGMSVSDDGTAYFVLGSGDGSGRHIINGVEYTRGAFKVEKNESYTNMGLVGKSPFITFWDDNGELWLSGDAVKINGVNILSEINSIKSRLNNMSI